MGQIYRLNLVVIYSVDYFVNSMRNYIFVKYLMYTIGYIVGGMWGFASK